jgi:cell wall-associated NlpC family hydrolase
MTAKAGRGWILLGAALLALMGCAEAPPLPAERPETPHLAAPGRPAQEVALERALGDFYGAPYKAGGCTPDGVDCSGFIQALYQQAGVKLPRTVAEQFHAGRPVPAPKELRFGDVVFFNRYCQSRGREVFLAGLVNPAWADEVCHNGLYLGEGRFVHASPRGVQVSRLDSEVWRKSYMGARRFLSLPPDGRAVTFYKLKEGEE